ncbi:MAG: flagellar hook-associated protein 3 [Treponema sp.]|nr:flagellar hook-associated protein 3 [Treponema sp.]
MPRVSSNLINNNVQQNLRSQESRTNKAQNQMGSQQRIQSLRDDPIAAGHLVRYQSYANRVDQFKHNAQTLTDQFVYSEGYINNSLQIMQRIRELAVTGANGIYGKDDMQNMATEVNELLKELIQNANAVSPDGSSLFAGTRTNRTAFEVSMGMVEGSAEALISSVRYNGTNESNNVEVDEHAYMNIDRDGSKLFWAENQRLFSERDATRYQVRQDSVIKVDGTEIKLNAGDSIFAIISKINDAGVAVKATIDPITNGLNLQTTDARLLWLHDTKGTTLQDLGLIKDSTQLPPYNLGNSVRVSGGSMFDTVIAFRDALLRGDSESAGSRVLGSIDSAIGNLITNIAKIGSDYERSQNQIAKAETNTLNVAQQISREGDLDITKAITDMKMLEYVHQASLSTAAKMYQNSLLNHIK